MDVDGEVEVETDYSTSSTSTIRPSTKRKLGSQIPKPIRVILPPTFDNNDEYFSTNTTAKSIQHRDMKWLSIVLPFIKKYNPHCGICASSKNYGRRLDTMRGYLLRAYFYCQGHDCPFNCIITIKDNGRGLLCSRFAEGNVVDHRNAKRVARPNRLSDKTKLKSNRRLSNTGTKRYCSLPSSAIHEWNEQCTKSTTTNFNTNEFAFTVNDFENPSEMTSEKRFIFLCCNLIQLTLSLKQDIDPTCLLPGALQHVSLKPFYTAIHTENSIRYYHSVFTKESRDKPPIMVQQNNSNDTTSQIFPLNTDIACNPVHSNSSITFNSPRHHIAYVISDSIKHDEKNYFYHEFMISNLDDTSFIPITLTYTEDNDDIIAQNYSIKSWLERFRFDHEYLYKSSLPSLSNTYRLPVPLVVLVDDYHETPLNNSILQFFNNETFKEYIMRTYLLVTSKIEYSSLQEPIDRIVLYVSSTTILFNFRTYVNKYVSTELRQLALWSSLLLLHTSTWREIKQNWSLICEIFLNWGTNFVSLKAYEDLCGKVSTIENDPDIIHLMDVIYNNTNDNQQEEENDDDDEEDLDETSESFIDLSDFQNDHFYTKNMITNEMNSYVSPYENDLRRIFNENNKSKTALREIWKTLTTSDRSTLKKIKGNWRWLHILLKDYLPTIPLWSNLIHSFTNNLEHIRLNKRISQLMVNKDKRMQQMKCIQITERIHQRMDHVIINSAKDLHFQVANADIKNRRN
ncbi:hypothetical protein I4U23_014501 [Adineta vaga]|nr:hypothetical protein I4U23_014501 [Adineta vaga]